VRSTLSAPLATAAFAVALLAAGCGGGSSSSPAAPSTTSSSTSTPAVSTGAYAWTQDVTPILTSDCTRCHSGAKPSAGVDLSTYAGTMRVVSAGNANSTLVLVTRSNGLMYGYLSGDRASKAELIRQWVVSGAPESR
jgi:ABC-type transport system substrate-binding protein